MRWAFQRKAAESGTQHPAGTGTDRWRGRPFDGTPIFDIKPYLPYVDAHPDARGGFTDTTKFYTLQVQAEPEVLEQIPADKRDALLGVLRSDPRPSYQHDPERLYGLSFGGVEVKFKVDGDVLTVVSTGKLKKNK